MKSYLERFRHPLVLAVAVAAAVAISAATTVGCGAKPEREATRYRVEAVVAQAQLGIDVRLAGQDCWLASGPSMPFMSGDAAWVPPGPGAFLLFGSGARMYVAAGSAFAFETRGGDRWLTVSRGAVQLDGLGAAGPALRTPAATIEASPGREAGGTLAMRVEPGGMTVVTVASGSAAVKGGPGSVTVQAGFTSTCSPGGEPSEPGPAVENLRPLSEVGFPYFVELQTETYFRNEATRDRAEDDARGKLEAVEEDAWSHVNLGRALLDAGEVARARASFERALELDPQFSQAYAGLGKASLLEGRWEEAQAAYASARRADVMSLEAVFGMGQAALGRGDLREAEKWFKETLDLDPEGTNPLTGLAAIDLVRQKRDRALDRLCQAAENEPTRTRAYPVMAQVYCLGGDLYSARESMVNALEVNRDDQRSRLGLGNLRARLGDLVAANSAFKELSGCGEPGWEAVGFQAMGVIEQMEGRPDAALDHWNRSLELDDRPPVEVDLGLASLLIEEYEGAILHFMEAVDADPDFWYPHEWLGRAYLADGSDPQAVTESQRAIELNPAVWVSRVVLSRALEDSAPDESRRDMAEARRLMPDGELTASERDLMQKRGQTP